MSTAPDPVTLEVVRNALAAAAEEMSLVVMRAARSPLLREAGDLSSAITDATGELVAQGRDIPMHLGVMSATVKAFLARVPSERLAPGDVWFLNLPETGGNHLPDVKAVRPVWAEGRLRAFAVSLAHWADIGGAIPGSYVPGATDAWQEGLRIPPLRLWTAAGPDREKLDLVLANLRGAPEREGDIRAQVAATLAAERRLVALYERHGAGVVDACLAALLARGEAQVRAALRTIPPGVYAGEDWLDDDAAGGEPVPIRVRITIGDGEATFDFTGSGDATRGPLNTTPYIAAASTFYAVKALVGADVDPCGGCYRPLRVLTRPGSVLDPGPERPVVGGNHETSQRVVDAIFRALEPVLGDILTAGGPTTSGLLLFAGRAADGRWVTLYETHGGGEGARADRDGMPVVRVHMSNVMNTPAEVIEAEYPLRIRRQSVRAGSGGAGRHRGGDGLHREYEVLADEMVLTTMFERRRVPPWGVRGGAPGAPFRVTLLRAGAAPADLGGKEHVRLGRGDRVVVESCGGGGYGTVPEPGAAAPVTGGAR